MIWKENRENSYCEITPAILALKEQWEKKNFIDPRLYKEYNVKRGLRDEDGRGVLTGLTRVAEIQSYNVTGESNHEHITPAEGVLYYRGIDVRDIVRGSSARGRFAFEEAAYLLLFGELPTEEQLQDFCVQLASYRTLPTNFFRDVIMKNPPRDLMNTMQRGILTLFCYDDKPNDIGLENVLRQCLQLTSNMPVLAIYAYQAWRYSQGESLFIHVPQPELSVERMEQNYYEEIYDADVIYVDNDSWYTTQTKILQQPSAGFRRVVADVSYLNDREVTRDILKEEVVMEAVPKIVERGTKIPPTYIKPISGGRLSSNFGRRKSPTKGASSYHKGVDWSVPTGTAVFASCGGTVARAGWGSGYGYCVYINHEDGRQTRYGHLSKVLVKVGQTVKQGERIALSGNTGVSTGPHLHFEILINGSQVNPLKYLN